MERESDSTIRKRTPLEQAIAEQKDRRVHWDREQAARGFKRTSMMVHVSKIEEVKAFVRRMNEEAASQ